MAKKDSKPKSTPSTTLVTPGSVSTTITKFSSAAASALAAVPLYYAHLHRAPDAHTLRIYDVVSGKCVSRWASNALGDEEELRVTAIAWALLPVPVVDAEVVENGAESQSSRGKKRRKSGGAEDTPVLAEEGKLPKLVLAMGLETGAIILWSPNGDNSTTLEHPSSTAPITALDSPIGGEDAGHLWSTQSDGEVRVWDLATGQVTARVAGLVPESSHWDDLAVRYLPATAEGGKKRKVQLLLSHLSLHVFSLSLSKSKADKVKDLKATEIGRCTGHVEAGFVQFNQAAAPLEDAASPLSFLSYSPADRFVQLWSLALPTAATRSEGTLVARLGLESGVKSLAVAVSPVDASEEIMVAVDAQGRVAIARLPAVFPEAVAVAGKKAKKGGVVALQIETEVVGRTGESANISAASIDGQSQLSLCRGGVKPVFQIITFADEAGSWLPKIELDRVSAGLLNGSAMEESASAPAPARYTELPTSNVGSGSAVVEPSMDDEQELANSGELDVDMAEPTLADRLKAMNVNKALMANGNLGGDESAEDEDVLEEDDEDEDDETVKKGPSVPSATLTTTLIQALHSADAPLLESCLSHTSTTLIRATVKRLSSGSLVLTLLEALVERLGKGKKGKQGTASVKRSRGLIEWVRQVLIVHVGFLVTIPSLVTRLASLHATLTSRLALQPTLLALNGRLELVMSQIDLRQERVAAQASLGAVKQLRGAEGGKEYVEGESGSESEGDEVAMEDDDESDDDEGSVEDVILGSDRSDDDEEEDDDEGSDDDIEGIPSSRVKPSAKVNGKRAVADLLELEASEEEGESEDDEDDDEDDEDSELDD